MKVGLEVHQQLAASKLFCACPSELSESVVARFSRRLRATGGENLAVDQAAAFQSSLAQTFDYEATPTSCLVELDEEPPHPLDPLAVDVALTVALLLDARPLDEIEVMRKIVVDGSNTSGFQRTALVAVDGSLEVDGRRYTIPSICLEEDAARRVGQGAQGPIFRLDRLGVPLIEIATGPEITSGAEARAVAEEIGALLRSTGRVRRGIGTIREDLNVSTDGGRRIEIKGVQELRKIHRYVESEEARQKALLSARAALRERAVRPPPGRLVDVTPILRATATGPLLAPLERGGAALAVALPGFGGLLRPSGDAAERLGRELAEQARAVGLRGLLHSDELPSQGIDAGALAQLRERLEVPHASDAFVLVVAPTREVGEAALKGVVERARAAIEGVPAETRDPLPDGRSRYSRPLPGRDRMYPETDVPPVPVDPARLERLRASLPERPSAVRRRLVERLHLSEELARQIYRAGEAERFEQLVARGHDAAIVARLLVTDLPALGEGDAEAAERLATAQLDELLAAVDRQAIAKEGIPAVLRALAVGGGSVDEAIGRAGLSTLERAELDRLANELVARNLPLVAARGAGAFAPLMGDLMKEVRGRRDGSEVAEALRAALALARP